MIRLPSDGGTYRHLLIRNILQAPRAASGGKFKGKRTRRLLRSPPTSLVPDGRWSQQTGQKTPSRPESFKVRNVSFGKCPHRDDSLCPPRLVWCDDARCDPALPVRLEKPVSFPHLLTCSTCVSWPPIQWNKVATSFLSHHWMEDEPWPFPPALGGFVGSPVETEQVEVLCSPGLLRRLLEVPHSRLRCFSPTV